MDLKVDLNRIKSEEFGEQGTGILVRARLDGRWAAVDIIHLTKESLLEWLCSRGGNNPWAEDVVGILLGHGHLHNIERKDDLPKEEKPCFDGGCEEKKDD